jgi:hypothetical protein
MNLLRSRLEKLESSLSELESGHRAAKRRAPGRKRDG